MGSKYQSTNETTADALKALQAHFEPARAAMAAGLTPQALAQLEADRASSPGYAQLQTDLAREFGPQLAQIGRDVSRLEDLGAASNEAEIARTFGPELVSAARSLQAQIDPGAEVLREKVAASGQQLLDFDPNTLSPYEMEAISRSAAQNRGFVNPASVTDTVRNAMTTGDRLNARRNNFADVVTKVASTLPATRMGVNAFEVATRRQLQPNFGTANFMGTQTGTGRDALNIGSQVFNTASSAALNKQKKGNWLDDFSQGVGALGGMFNFQKGI